MSIIHRGTNGAVALCVAPRLTRDSCPQHWANGIQGGGLRLSHTPWKSLDSLEDCTEFAQSGIRSQLSECQGDSVKSEIISTHYRIQNGGHYAVYGNHFKPGSSQRQCSAPGLKWSSILRRTFVPMSIPVSTSPKHSSTELLDQSTGINRVGEDMAHGTGPC